MGACGSNTKKQTITTVLKPIEVVKKSYRTLIVMNNNAVHEETFLEDTDINRILTIIKGKLDPDAEYDYYLLDTIENIRINITYRIGEKIQSIIPSKLLSDQITIEVVYSGMEISSDIKKYLIDNNYYISTPKYDSEPFEIVVYDKRNQNIIFHIIQDSSYNYIKQFNSFSAYCNGNNKLYISGGGLSEKELLSIFIEVDLTNLTQPDHIRRLPDLVHARSWHSMIFVPPKFVFLVGGSNTKSVEVYNTETNTVHVDSTLNENRSETTLCCVNNTFLYAFCGFLIGHNFINSIEKCNLKRKERNWEMVNVLLENGLVIEPSFFSVAYEKGNNIVLFGGNEDINQKNKNKNYIFSQINEEHRLDVFTPHDITEAYVCNEKFFMPFDEKMSGLIPSFLSDSLKILHFNSEQSLLYEIKYASLSDLHDERFSLKSVREKERELIKPRATLYQS
jgi:hypothetical protein